MEFLVKFHLFGAETQPIFNFYELFSLSENHPFILIYQIGNLKLLGMLQTEAISYAATLGPRNSV